MEDRLINYIRVYEQKKRKKLEDLEADYFQPKTHRLQKSKKYSETKSRYKQVKEQGEALQKMGLSKESSLKTDLKGQADIQSDENKPELRSPEKEERMSEEQKRKPKRRKRI